MEEKINLRKYLLKQRQEMSKEEVEGLSKRITENLIQTPSLLKGKVVMVYLSFKNEVDTEAIIKWCFDQGKEVIIPYCVVESKEIIPCKLDPERKGLEKNKLGLWEPKKDLMVPVDMETIDVIVVPGVGFDKSCNRLGFGAGYYDRFLAKRQKDIEAVGICYESQIVEDIPRDSYDLPMDMVVTEKNRYYRK